MFSMTYGVANPVKNPSTAIAAPAGTDVTRRLQGASGRVTVTVSFDPAVAGIR